MKIRCPKCGHRHAIASPDTAKGGRNRWLGVTSAQRSKMAKKGWQRRKLQPA